MLCEAESQPPEPQTRLTVKVGDQLYHKAIEIWIRVRKQICDPVLQRLGLGEKALILVF